MPRTRAGHLGEAGRSQHIGGNHGAGSWWEPCEMVTWRRKHWTRDIKARGGSGRMHRRWSVGPEAEGQFSALGLQEGRGIGQN